MTDRSVSVVVPTFNGRKHLATLLAALSAQTFPPEQVELVVVDNGSRDGTAAFLHTHHPAVQVIHNDENVGFATSCNQGAAHAHGRYVAFLNNDMRPEPQWLDRMVGALETSPSDVVCVASRIENWDGTRVDFAGGGISFNGMGYQDGHGAPVGSSEDPPSRQRLLFACGGAMLVGRDVFLDVGGFDDRFFAFYEDVDLGWRLWVLGHEVAFCSEAIVYHRGGATGARLPAYRKLALLERNALYSVLKNYGDEMLAVVWPAALLLAVKRAAVRAGVPRQAFAPAGATAVTKTGSSIWRNRASTVARVLRREGGSTSFAGTPPKIRRALLGKRRTGRATSSMPLDAYAALVAIEDVVTELPSLLEKRRWIQEHRRRSDAEIFGLFPPRFVPESDHPVYADAYRTVVDALGVRAVVRGERMDDQ